MKGRRRGRARKRPEGEVEGRDGRKNVEENAGENGKARRDNEGCGRTENRRENVLRKEGRM